MDDYATPENEAALRKLREALLSDPMSFRPNRTTATQRTAHRLVSGGAFVLDQPDETPAVWGAGDKVLWAEGEGLMIAGSQGLGKTTIAGQLMKARMGIGPSYCLGYPVKPSAGRVLYLAMDRPQQAARSLHRMFGDSDRAALDEKLLVHQGPTMIKIANDPMALADWISDLDDQIDFVVMDSVKDLVSGLSSDDVGSVTNMAWQEIIARDIQLLVLHHERKKSSTENSRAPSLDNIYGSTWLTTGLGSILQLIGTPGDPEVELHHVKQPAEEVGPLKLLHDHKAGITTVQYQLSIEDVLRSADANGVTILEIVDSVEASEATVRRKVSAFERDGSVVQVAAAVPSAFGLKGATYRWNEG